MVPFGPFAYDVARTALDKYRQRKREAEVRAEVENLARLTFEQAREAADAPAGDRATLVLYLTAIPAAVQRPLRRRNPDGQGFAAFGRVVKGMDVVRKIWQEPADGQTLKPPVKILTARRRP